MAVHFSFAAFNFYKSVPCVGDFISLSELKDAIAAPIVAALKGKKLRETFDFRIYDHDTKEEIVGDTTRVRKNASVIVKRVPACSLHRQRITIYTRTVDRLIGLDNGGIKTINKHAEEVIDEGIKVINKRVEEVIDDGFVGDVYSRSTTSTASIASNVSRKKVEQVRKEIRNSSKTEERPCIKNVVQSVHVPCSEIPLELMCMLCRNIMEDPMLIPCCFKSFCGNCIRVTLTEHRKCPECKSSRCSDADLLPNRHVKSIIDTFRKSSPSVLPNGPCSSQTTSSLVREVKSQRTTTTAKNASDQKTPILNGLGNGLLGKRKPLFDSLNSGAKLARVC